MKQIIIDNIRIDLERKRIKNMYLRIKPPEGQVTVTAPVRMSEEEIKSFIRTKLGWIEQQQAKIRQRQTGQVLDYVTGEEIYLWGQKLTLEVLPQEGRAKASLMEDRLLLKAPAGSQSILRERVMNAFYKEQLLLQIPPLLLKWEKLIGVKTEGFTIRDMKTRWGTCNIRTKKICLSLQLAKKKPDCLEYVIVHELVHLLEPSHNSTFKAYLDKFLPGWRTIKKEMNGGHSS